MVSDYFWKYSDRLFENHINVPEQCSKTLVTMFRNTIEMFPNTIKNIANTFEIFQNTFENAQEHFWKRSGTLKKCSGTLWIVTEHLWKYSGTLFENRLNVPEQYSETLVTMFRSTLVKMFQNNLECSRTLLKKKHFWELS